MEKMKMMKMKKKMMMKTIQMKMILKMYKNNINHKNQHGIGKNLTDL